MKPTRVRAQPLPAAAQPTIARDVPSVLAWLAAHSSPQILAGMARYGMPAENALGVAVGDIQLAGKLLGRDHALAAALWKTGGYEARMVAAYVDEPGRVTAAQMDRWVRDFDSWGICDTVCFVLFDRTPHAWAKVEAWSDRPEEFVKRAAFAAFGVAGVAGLALVALAGHWWLLALGALSVLAAWRYTGGESPYG